MIALSKYQREELIRELQFETSRSGGKGGQHANKTESRVTLVFNVSDSQLLNFGQKERLQIVLDSRLQAGVLRISSEAERSQHRNKEIVIRRFFELLESSLQIPKKRIPTKLSAAKKKARLEAKKRHQQKKNLRKKIRKDDY